MKLYGTDSYFTTKEFECKCGCGFGSTEKDISEKLICYLNEVRELINQPLTVTSGARCKEYNLSINGSINSAHLPNPNSNQCEAVDIKVISGSMRWGIVRLGVYCGFRRMGVDKHFIHLDVAVHLPTPVLWTY